MTNRRLAVLFVLCLTAAGRASAEDQKEKEKPRDARETVVAFVDAATHGRFEEAAKLGQPGQSPSRPESIKNNFAQIKIEKFAVKSVHADAAAALAISSDVKDDRGREGPLAFTVIKKEDRWLIHDIDFETAESVKDELKRFLEKHPSAKPVAEKKKDAKEGEKKSK